MSKRSIILTLFSTLMVWCYVCGVAQADIEILTDVESGHIIEDVTWLRSEERLHILLRPDIPNHWFLFALKGVKGKQLTIEVEAQSTIHDIKAWKGVKPVMADTVDISDPLLYDEAAYRLKNGHSPWRRIQKVRYDDEFRTMTFVESFDEDEATIAMKYPSPVSYVENRLEQLAPLAAQGKIGIYQAGQPKAKPPLRLITIPSMDGANAARWKEKPTILIYGGEHATEHESSQVVMGALEWLIQDYPQASKYRDDYNVILIPHLFPYDTTISRFNLLTEGFAPSPYFVTAEEHELWAKFFNNYIDSGNHIDVAVSVHNTAGSESVNFFNPLSQTWDDDLKYTAPLNSYIMTAAKKRGWKVRPELGTQGNWGMRLVGWLNTSFASNALFYEVNGQMPSEQLSLTQVQSAGISILQGTQTYFNSDLFTQQREREKQRFLVRQQKKVEHPVKDPWNPDDPPYWWIFNSLL